MNRTFFNSLTCFSFFTMAFLLAGCNKERPTPTPPTALSPFRAKVNYTDRCHLEFKAFVDSRDSGFIGLGFVLGNNRNPDINHFIALAWETTEQKNEYTFPMNYTEFVENKWNYLRAYIHYNNDRYVYSTVDSFFINNPDTIPGIPEVKTIALPDNNGYSSDAKGFVIREAGSHIIHKGYIISTERGAVLSTALGVKASEPSNYCDTAYGSVSTSYIPGIEENKPYYVRAFAENRTGVGYGEDIPFIYRDPYALTFNFRRNVPVDTLLGEYFVAGAYNHITSVVNHLILPSGISMYAEIVELRGDITSNLGTLHVGDIFPVDASGAGFEAPFIYDGAPPFAHYCKFRIVLRGITTDNQYYCKYTYQSNPTNTTSCKTFESKLMYPDCSL